MHVEEVKLRAGTFYIPVKLEHREDRIFLDFPYNPQLLKEVKLMEGRKWHGFEKPKPRKQWSIPVTPHNLFQLEYLRKDRADPYSRYDLEIIQPDFDRSLYLHQCNLASEVLIRRYMIWAAEMGTGKTLAAIEVMERSGYHSDDCLWVGPKSANAAVFNEFGKWDSRIWPEMVTYEGLRKMIDNWHDGDSAPRLVVFDESSRAKTITALRTKAAMALADGMRKDHGDDCIILLMSGTPAPKSPLDWFAQCRIAQPGFLKEGSMYAFKETLAIYEERQNKTGGSYPHLVAWRDNDTLCTLCGKSKDDEDHESMVCMYKPMVNEVDRLYRRMKGLVTVLFKKDCLDLPDKVYRIIECEPKPSTLRAASLLAKRAPRAATALILLRELSDGFQYKRTKNGDKACTCCNETGTVPEYEETENGDPKIKGQIECPVCKGSLKEPTYAVEVVEVDCPKEPAFIELLEDHLEYGRMVAYAGFTASIDRVVKICHSKGWGVVRVDGRGCQVTDPKGKDLKINLSEALEFFQDKSRLDERLVFVGQPGAAGMGITLTASPSIVYWSNDHNGESRVQSEDRIHRPGMLGANIIDLVHLPTDRQVLENLRKKRKLELMSLGQLSSLLETVEKREES